MARPAQSSSKSRSYLDTAKIYWKKTRVFLSDDKSFLSFIVNLLIAFILIKFIIYPGLGFAFGTSLPVVAVVSSSMEHGGYGDRVCGIGVDDSYSGSLDDYWTVCGAWYEERNISKTAFETFSFKRGFNKGDIMVLVGEKRSDIELGDIIVFEAQKSYPVIHRVVSITASDAGVVYATKGDNNPDQIKEYALVDIFGVTYRCQSQGQPSSCGVGSPVTASTPNAVRLIDETTITADAVYGKAVLRIPWLGYAKIWFTNLLQLFID